MDGTRAGGVHLAHLFSVYLRLVYTPVLLLGTRGVRRQRAGRRGGTAGRGKRDKKGEGGARDFEVKILEGDWRRGWKHGRIDGPVLSGRLFPPGRRCSER